MLLKMTEELGFSSMTKDDQKKLDLDYSNKHLTRVL